MMGELTTTPNVTGERRMSGAATAGLFAAATAGSRKGDGRRTVAGGALGDDDGRGGCDGDDRDANVEVNARANARGERATVGSARECDGVSDTDDVIRENAHRWRPTSATTIDDVAGDDGETEVFGDERATLRRGVHGEKRKEAPDASERETFGGFGNASDGNFGASALEFK
jgi:hypothetical protein